jgi:hypothetical protein
MIAGLKILTGDATMKLTADAIHNWSTPYIQRQYQEKVTLYQAAEIREAERRHHQKGTDAKVEAEELNRRFNW